MKRISKWLVAFVLLGFLTVEAHDLSGDYACTFAEDGPFSCDPQVASPPAPPPAPPPVGFIAIPPIPFDYLQTGTPNLTGNIPLTLTAGDVLDFTGQVVAVDQVLACSGTEQNPAIIIGGTLQGSNDVFRISGSWCVFIDTVFDNIQPRTSGDHHIFRGVEIRNLDGKNGSSFSGTDIVVTDSEIHHNQGDDRHGIYVGSGSDGVWLLNNYIHHNGGDGFQACHKCSVNPPRNVYLGGNVFHSDRENAIDFKYIENVIVESNTIHSLVSAPKDVLWCFDDGSKCDIFSSGSDGSAIVVGSDGAPSGVQIINNEIYGTVHAVRIEEGVNVSLEGNYFHDISGSCLQLDKWGLDTVYSVNTCLNAGRGIAQQWRSNFSLTVDQNQFQNIVGPSIEYESRDVWEASIFTNNIFSNSGPVIHGNITYKTEEEINAITGASGNTVQ